MNEFPAHFVEQWKQLLSAHQRGRRDDFPSTSAKDIDSLITTSIPQSLHVGTGYSIFQRAIIPAISTATRSVYFVTCYWAASPTLDALRDALLQLAASRARTERQQPPLKVTVGFSSVGLLQKLLHTTSRDGYTYPPSRWASLGLPDDGVLRRGGVEMTVKSLFFTPLSVMHPKYVIIDGAKHLCLAATSAGSGGSEGCVELHGEILERLLNFHSRVWGRAPLTMAHQVRQELRRLRECQMLNVARLTKWTAPRPLTGWWNTRRREVARFQTTRCPQSYCHHRTTATPNSPCFRSFLSRTRHRRL